MTFLLYKGVGNLPRIGMAGSYGISIFIFFLLLKLKDNFIRVSQKISSRQAVCLSTCLEQYGKGSQAGLFESS